MLACNRNGAKAVKWPCLFTYGCRNPNRLPFAFVAQSYKEADAAPSKLFWGKMRITEGT
jgi:hypothetical protein